MHAVALLSRPTTPTVAPRGMLPCSCPTENINMFGALGHRWACSQHIEVLPPTRSA